MTLLDNHKELINTYELEMVKAWASMKFVNRLNERLKQEGHTYTEAPPFRGFMMPIREDVLVLNP